MKYQPKYDGERWHAASLLPGAVATWSSITECPDKRCAEIACDELNKAARANDKTLATDRKLRGLRR